MRMLKFLTLLLLIGFPRVALAQNDSGRISRAVRDQSSAVVAGAMVTVKNDKTGQTRSTTSNAEGFFAVPALRPSTYTITVTKDGFAPIEYTQVPVSVGQELVLDFEFKPAGLTESVSVTASSPVLDVSSAKIGANVSEREVQGLPVNGRQMSQLMLQAPGSQNAGTGTWGDIRFSGRAVEQNVVKYDGVKPRGLSTPRRALRTAKTRLPSNCRRASRMCRNSGSNQAAIRRSSVPVPAAR
jgi:carboxypeptidase family protein